MRKRFGIIIALVVVGVMTVGQMVWAEDTLMTPLDIPMIGDMEALEVGDTVSAFKLYDTEGDRVEFEPLGEGASVLVFWSIFCEPCRAEMPLIQGMHEKYKDKGLTVIAIALDGDLGENIRQFAKQGGYTFTILLDEESEDGSLVVAEDYMVPGTPTIYVIDGKAKITYSKVGRVGEAEMERAIENALGK